jgi:hypothetical protein
MGDYRAYFPQELKMRIIRAFPAFARAQEMGKEPV